MLSYGRKRCLQNSEHADADVCNIRRLRKHAFGRELTSTFFSQPFKQVRSRKTFVTSMPATHGLQDTQLSIVLGAVRARVLILSAAVASGNLSADADEAGMELWDVTGDRQTTEMVASNDASLELLQSFEQTCTACIDWIQAQVCTWAQHNHPRPDMRTPVRNFRSWAHVHCLKPCRGLMKHIQSGYQRALAALLPLKCVHLMAHSAASSYCARSQVQLPTS